MTKIEYKKCETVMEEAIIKAKDANEKFYEAGKSYDTPKRHVLETMAWDHRGYAEGVNQVLVSIGFKHDRMKELGKLIS